MTTDYFYSVSVCWDYIDYRTGDYISGGTQQEFSTFAQARDFVLSGTFEEHYVYNACLTTNDPIANYYMDDSRVNIVLVNTIEE